MSDDTPPALNRYAAFAAQALVVAARTPGAMVLALCKNKQTGALVTTLCMLNAESLTPFALVPDFDLHEHLEAPTDCISVRQPDPPPAARTVGFDTKAVH